MFFIEPRKILPLPLYKPKNEKGTENSSNCMLDVHNIFATQHEIQIYGYFN